MCKLRQIPRGIFTGCLLSVLSILALSCACRVGVESKLSLTRSYAGREGSCLSVNLWLVCLYPRGVSQIRETTTGQT